MTTLTTQAVSQVPLFPLGRVRLAAAWEQAFEPAAGRIAGIRMHG